MRFLDKVLQQWRFRVAEPWLPEGVTVLDIGCFQGEFLDGVKHKIFSGTGLDPLALDGSRDNLNFKKFYFKERLPFDDETFDAVCLLAVLEHLPDVQLMAQECARVLRKGGRAILTVPSPKVDDILHLLIRLSLLDGMSTEEHHHFDVNHTNVVFEEAGLRLLTHRRFQLGLNNLFVFLK